MLPVDILDRDEIDTGFDKESCNVFCCNILNDILLECFNEGVKSTERIIERCNLE